MMNSMFLLAFATTVLYGIDNCLCDGNCKSIQCTVCQNNRCYSCNVGYFVYNGDCVQCPVTCATCKDNLECYSCRPNYWNLSALCTPCPQNCPTGCDVTTGYCFTCTTNLWYGNDCSQPCSLCKDGLCNRGSCTNGCKDGYFVDNYQGYIVCRACSANCLTCSSSDYCVTCEDGYTVTDRKCVSASACSQTCLTGCKQDRTCNGCVNGLSGLYCNESCSQWCVTCSQTDISYCYKCKGDRYTTKCETPCSTNCLQIYGKITCDLNNGSCLNGCAKNTWGEKCENQCSQNCQNGSGTSANVCSRESGSCLFGCAAGYTGPSCDIPIITSMLSSKPTHASSTTTVVTTLKEAQIISNGSPEVAVGAGVGCGIVVLVGVMIFVIFMVKRRRRKATDSTKETHAIQAIPMSTNTDTLYAHPNKKKPVPTQDFINAQPNKQRKPQSLRNKSEVKENNSYNNTSTEVLCEPQTNVYDTITVDLESGFENARNKEETLTLEDVDDGAAVTVQKEYDIPTSDTYYNTEGLLKSRLQVSDLPEYVRGKKNFEAEFEIIPQGLTRACKEALKPSNRVKNRYNGIYAYDATRVVLQSKEYINACYIEGHNNSASYIASLGPAKSAMPQFAVFWEMVWKGNTRKIVMLTNLVESEKMKCDQYWPDEGSMRSYGHVSVTNKSEKIFTEYIVRELQIAKTTAVRMVSHYHYTAWPDKSVPDTVASLVDFRDVVERDEKTSVGPIIVHCSAGIGRTGTYIALDSLIKQGKREDSVDILGCVMALRGQRVNMVQNVEQYIYLHHCVAYALTCSPSTINASELTQTMTDSKIQKQYQSYSSLPAIPEKEISVVNTNKKRKENRREADIPGDRHRVKIKMKKKDYINAVYVDGYECSNQYIATQTPMPTTVDDFVAMLHQENVAQIVCLDEENATDKTIAKYIPSVNKSTTFGQFQISAMRFETHDAFNINELKLGKAGSAPSDVRIVKHYQVKGWAMGKDLPTSATAFLQLVKTVKKSYVASAGPVVVHCLDGARKCGLFCAVANMLDKLSIDKQLSVLNTICQVRARRRSAMQNFDQFKFCYRCVKEYLETAESKTYYNIL